MQDFRKKEHAFVREVPAKAVEETVRSLLLDACIVPDDSAREALAACAEAETCPHAREILRQLEKNNSIAETARIPACQDTGMAVVFIEMGQDVHITGPYLEDAVNEGVRRAYEDGFFRKSVLDPLSRKNTKTNLPAVQHVRIVPGSGMRITVVPKGFGSENMSRIAMLKPSEGREGILDFVCGCAGAAGGSPCPPVILGIGIGGTFEKCALLSKEALLYPVGKPNENKDLDALEREILERVNALGIGPMGLGGDTYCLGVHVKSCPTHLAGLPVAVNISCHQLRHKTAFLPPTADGAVFKKEQT